MPSSLHVFLLLIVVSLDRVAFFADRVSAGKMRYPIQEKTGEQENA
ncbi:MAG: hypothetical protein U0412_05935 [Nitrospira sp.]